MHSKAKLSVLLLFPVMGVLLFGLGASARSRKDHPYRYSVIDMPVSLALGSVRTPTFPVVSHWYWIMIQVEKPKPLPFGQMRCMMGVTSGAAIDMADCSSNDPLLRADWTVLDGEHIVAQGSSTTTADAAFTDKYIFKFLGKFPGEAGEKYVVEVKFTKDGSPLNIANPHLIVTKIGYE